MVEVERHWDPTDQGMVERVVAFHGHMCAGLAIGVQAARLARREMPATRRPEDLVAVVETDMCAVDAIQVLTGCTFGKGNLIHHDWGKNAYTFFDLPARRALRLAPRPGVWEQEPEHQALIAKVRAGTASSAEQVRFEELHQAWVRRLLDAAPDELFSVTEVDGTPPARIRIHVTVTCEACGESAKETRIHRLGGRALCTPCFERACLEG